MVVISQEVTELHGGRDGPGSTETETPYYINYSVLVWSTLSGGGGR